MFLSSQVFCNRIAFPTSYSVVEHRVQHRVRHRMSCDDRFLTCPCFPYSSRAFLEDVASRRVVLEGPIDVQSYPRQRRYLQLVPMDLNCFVSWDPRGTVDLDVASERERPMVGSTG